MKLIYCAIPSGMYEKSRSIMDYIGSKNCAPLNPLLAFPLERFEFGVIGRKETMEYCKKLINICDEIWLFGLSRGTIEEILYSIKIKKPIRVIKRFDEEWEKKESDFSNEIELIKKNRIILNTHPS